MPVYLGTICNGPVKGDLYIDENPEKCLAVSSTNQPPAYGAVPDLEIPIADGAYGIAPDLEIPINDIPVPPQKCTQVVGTIVIQSTGEVVKYFDGCQRKAITDELDRNNFLYYYGGWPGPEIDDLNFSQETLDLLILEAEEYLEATKNDVPFVDDSPLGNLDEVMAELPFGYDDEFVDDVVLTIDGSIPTNPTGKVLCYDGTFDIPNGIVKPCLGHGGEVESAYIPETQTDRSGWEGGSVSGGDGDSYITPNLEVISYGE